jgi:hypothetical protein
MGMGRSSRRSSGSVLEGGVQEQRAGRQKGGGASLVFLESGWRGQPVPVGGTRRLWGRRHAQSPARGGGAAARRRHGGRSGGAQWIEEEEGKGQAKSFCIPIHRGTLPWRNNSAKVVNLYPNHNIEGKEIIDTVKMIIGESSSVIMVKS